MEHTIAPIRVIDRAVRVLDVLSEHGDGMGVSEIARRVELAKGTTHRLLASLSRADLVRLDAANHRYSLGLGLFRWSAAWLERLDVRTRALPHLRRLKEACQETVSLNILDRRHRVAVERLEASHEVRFVVELGRPLPLHLGASGKVILAFLPADVVAEVADAAGLDRRRRARLGRDLADIRRTGSAYSVGERLPGAAAVSAPVFNHEGRVVASVSILSLVARLPRAVIESHRALIVGTARAVSEELCWRGGSHQTGT